MSNGFFGMSDVEFWEQPQKGYDQVYEKAILDGAPGLYIDAPQTADVSARRTIPIPLFYAAKQRDSWGLHILRDAVVVASRLEDRGCWAGGVQALTGDADKELPDPKRFARPQGPPPDPERLDDQFVVFDLCQTTLAPWERGTYEARVIIRQQVSEPVRTKLQDPPPAFADPEVAKFLAAYAQPVPAPGPVHPAPGDPLPSYQQRDDSPPVPERPGVSFTLPRVLVLDEGAEARLKLSFRLPVLRGDIVPPAAPGAPLRPAAPAPTAIVPLHLLLTGSEDPDPALLRLRVPVWTALDPKAQGPQYATGHVTLDLFRLYPPLRRALPQTFFCYAISGEAFEGPVLMALVGKDQLPR